VVTVCCGGVEFTGIAAIIFDKDGTLEDSPAYLRALALKRSRLIDAQIPGVGEPLLMAFGVQGGEIDHQGLMVVGSRVENEIAAAAYIAETGRPWPEARHIARQAFENADRTVTRDRTTSPPFPGVAETLERLHRSGLTLGVLSAGTTPEVEEFVSYSELRPWLALELGHEPDGLAKPDPALYRKACDRLHLPPEQTLMVGDSEFDWAMARAAGAAGVVGICWGNPGRVPAGKVDGAIGGLAEIKVV